LRVSGAAALRVAPVHLRAAKEIRERYPKTACSSSPNTSEGYALELLRGAARKEWATSRGPGVRPAGFVAAVKRVAEGGSALDPGVVAHRVGRHRSDDPLGALSAGEREVLELMAAFGTSSPGRGRPGPTDAAYAGSGAGAPSGGSSAVSPA
jgi:hypothetical protein